MITPEEQERRRFAVAFNRANNRLEGLEPLPETREIEDRYIRGEIDDAGLTAELFALAAAIANNPAFTASLAEHLKGKP